jgi:hypothetical protein
MCFNKDGCWLIFGESIYAFYRVRGREISKENISKLYATNIYNINLISVNYMQMNYFVFYKFVFLLFRCNARVFT